MIGIGDHASNSNIATATLVISGRTTTPGSVLVLGFQWDQAIAFTSIADSKGNTWTQIGTELDAGAGVYKSRMYRAEGGARGTLHDFTLTLAAGAVKSMWMAEIIGEAQPGFDQAARVHDVATPFNSGNITTTGRVLLLGFGNGTGGANPDAFTWNDGETVLEAIVDGTTVWTGAFAYRIVAADGTYSEQFTATSSTTAGVWIVSFKEAAPGSAHLDLTLLDSEDEGHFNELDVRNWW